MKDYSTEIGKIYGCYKILNVFIDKNFKRSKVRCNCECTLCGKLRVVSLSHLKNRNYQFCPECRPNRKETESLIGQKFGKLTVVERIANHIQPNGSSKIVYKCLCECGTECFVQKHHLQNGHTTSCGCVQKKHTGEAHKKDITGKKYGLLTAKESFYKDGVLYWKCSCDCGGEKITQVRCLNSGRVHSCGCISSLSEYNFEQLLKEHNVQYVKQYKFSDCKYKRSLPFDFAIKINDKIVGLVELQGEQHYYPFTFCGESKEKKKNNVEKLQVKDSIKRNYCKNNNIPLLEIKYIYFNKLWEIFEPFYEKIKNDYSI